MANAGNSSLPLIYFWPGNPTNVAVSEVNAPKGSLFIDYSTPAIWIKTSAQGDNSGFTGGAGSTLTGPLISGGLTASGSASNDFSGSTGTFKTSTGVATFGGSGNNFTNSITFTVAASGIVLKQGSNGKCGTFVANGVTPVTISNTSIAITDTIVISLNTVGGTVGVQPHVATITASTGFTVICSASDTSTYNYAVISNAA